MTGYPAKQAYGRSPAFLQGPKTSPAVRVQMREALNAGKAVHAELINYKKNGTTYLCELDITPLRNAEGHITHFIALENERP